MEHTYQNGFEVGHAMGRIDAIQDLLGGGCIICDGESGEPDILATLEKHLVKAEMAYEKVKHLAG